MMIPAATSLRNKSKEHLARQTPNARRPGPRPRPKAKAKPKAKADTKAKAKSQRAAQHLTLLITKGARNPY